MVQLCSRETGCQETVPSTLRTCIATLRQSSGKTFSGVLQSPGILVRKSGNPGLAIWPRCQRTRPPCAVELDVLSGRGSRLSPSASAYQRIIYNNCYAHDEQGVTPRQVRAFKGVLYKLWLLLMPWLAVSGCHPRWREIQSRQMWLCPLARRWRSVNQVARRWRSAGQGWHWISAIRGLARQQATPREGPLRNTWQAAYAYCFFFYPTQLAHTLHTPTNSPPLPGLAHWTDIKVSALGSR